MATRREVDVAIQGVESANGEQAKQIAELRTAVAVGPSGLPELKSRNDEATGEQRALLREKREVISAQNRQIALIGTIAGVLSLIVYLIVAVHP
jgi:hypothetical protein